MVLNGTGTCKTSPFDFQSFVSGQGSEDMDSKCKLEVYPEADCGGLATTLVIDALTGEKCHFQGGRSARLNCTIDDQSEGKPL